MLIVLTSISQCFYQCHSQSYLAVRENSAFTRFPSTFSGYPLQRCINLGRSFDMTAIIKTINGCLCSCVFVFFFHTPPFTGRDNYCNIREGVRASIGLQKDRVTYLPCTLGAEFLKRPTRGQMSQQSIKISAPNLVFEHKLKKSSLLNWF